MGSTRLDSRNHGFLNTSRLSPRISVLPTVPLFLWLRRAVYPPSAESRVKSSEALATESGPFLVHCKSRLPRRTVSPLIHFSAGDPSEEEGFVSLGVQEFAPVLEDLSAHEVLVQHLPAGQSVVVARNFSPLSALPEELTTAIVFHHSLHGNEGELVEKVKQMPAEGELWIIRNDDAAGICALGVNAGLIAEEALFTVHSVLFKDTSLSADESEGWIHTIHHNPKILEDHLKVTASGEFLVRRAIQGSPNTKDFEIHHVGYSKNSHGRRSVATAYPPLPGPNEFEVAVEAFGLTDCEAETPLTAFVGSVDGKKVLGYSYQKLIDIVAVDKKVITSLPESVSVADAVHCQLPSFPPGSGLSKSEGSRKYRSS